MIADAFVPRGEAVVSAKGHRVSANVRPEGRQLSAPCTVGVFFVP